MNPVLLIVIPLLLAFIAVFVKSIAKPLLILGALFNVVSLFFYDHNGLYVKIGGFNAHYGISLLLDNYAFVALFFINILFLLLLVVNFNKIKKMSIVLLIALGGLNGLLLTHDLFNLFVFLEISGIAAYILTTENKKVKYTFQYLIIGSVGSSLYLLGLIILYAMVGSLNMSDVANSIRHTITLKEALLPLLLMFIGLGVEVKLLPFSSWVKGILEHATGLIGVLIASIYAGTMLFVFGRLFTSVFTLPDTLIQIIVIIGIVTLIAAEFAAFSSHKLREVLLFSSIAQSGLIVILFVYNLPTLGVLMIISNILSKFIMFTIAGLIAETNENDDVDKLKGIFSQHKILGLSFTIASLSLAGLPIFFGFLVKLNVLYNLILIDKVLIVVIILATSVIEGAYLIRILVKLWNSGEEGEYANVHKNTFNLPKKPVVALVVFVLALVIVVWGVYPDYTNILHNVNNNPDINPLSWIEQLGGYKL